MRKELSIILFWLLIFNELEAQEKQIPFGIGYRVGLSQNLQYDRASGTNNLGINSAIPSYSNVIFTLINIRKGDNEHFLQHLKLSISWSERSGIFDINGANQKVKLGYLETEILAPFRIKVSDEIYLSMGVGANMSFKILQTKGTPGSKLFQPGPVFEMGLVTRNGSYFGFHLLNTYADYSIQNLAFNIGITQKEMIDSFKKMREIKN